MTSCPNCDYPIPPGRRALCPNCHYALILDDAEPSREALAQEGLSKPTVVAAADETTVYRPVPSPAETPAERTMQLPGPVGQGVPPQGYLQGPGQSYPQQGYPQQGYPPGYQQPGYPPPPQHRPVPPPPSGRGCPSCGHVNPDSQRRCERCAFSLEAPQEAYVPPPPPVTRQRRSAGPLIAIVAFIVLAGLLVGAGYWWFTKRDPAPTATATTSAPTVPPVKVDPGLVTAKASSELPSDTGKYAIANVLDGDLTKAWNSDGKKIGPTGKVTLTFTFGQPVDLRQVEFFNGYQKSQEAYFNNGRPHNIVITTDAGTQQAELKDEFGSQKVTLTSPGKTTKVTVSIESVYRDDTTKYADMAISDIVFYQAG